LNGITAPLREAGPDDTPESLEAERQAAQEFIDNGKGTLKFQFTWLIVFVAEPLTEIEMEQKERCIEEGFPEWSRRDFQQFVRTLETYGWYVHIYSVPYNVISQLSSLRHEDWDLFAAEIQDKSAAEVKEYYNVFKKKWKQLAGMLFLISALSALTSPSKEYPRIAARIAEGEAKRNKRDNLEYLLTKKIASVRYPMQELELNYPTTKGKVYSEEEDRYLLCRLNHYGMRVDDVYERIKRDITEFPVFRFDWFFKSRSPQELQRRCNTLLAMIEKEAEAKQQEEVKAKSSKGKVCRRCQVYLYYALISVNRNGLSTRCKRRWKRRRNLHVRLRLIALLLQ
jgi:SWI/SNF-related matrix-associated actin-dependent regulator of chromatin subfamily A member 5